MMLKLWAHGWGKGQFDHPKHYMPSGYSILVGACAYFIMRRYSIWFGVIVIPVLLFTMYARVMLDKHTVSATISGAATGLLVAALFSTKLTGFRSQIVRFFGVK